MALFNIAEDANPAVQSGTSEALNQYGRTSMPAQMNGEGLERTPYLNAVGMAKQNVTMPSGAVWSEPGVPFSGTTQGAVWHARYGGSYVEIGGGPNAEFVNIIHQSGSRITIAQDGSITISSAGDIVLSSDENSVEVFDGAKEGMYKAGYTIGVSGGKTVINSASSIDLISGQDINLLAGGAINLNAGNGIDLSSTRIAMTAKVDTIDLYSEGKLSIESLTELHVKSGEAMFMQNKSMNIKSAEALKIGSKSASILSSDAMNIQGKGLGLSGGGSPIVVVGSTIDLNSPGKSVTAEEAAEAKSANKSALKAPPPYIVDSQQPVSFSAGGISATDVDDATS
jgi:uncharacterized protein (DUF2345 family)